MHVQSQCVYGICLTILCERLFKLRNNRGYNTQPQTHPLSGPEDPCPRICQNPRTRHRKVTTP